MTIEDAKKEVPSFREFADKCCLACEANWYCCNMCETLRSTYMKWPYENILQAYAGVDGDVIKTLRVLDGELWLLTEDKQSRNM